MLGDRALRLAQAAVPRQAFHGVHFLTRQHRKEEQAAIHHPQHGARAVTRHQCHRAGAAFALRTAFFRTRQALRAQEIQKCEMCRKTARIHRALVNQELHRISPKIRTLPATRKRDVRIRGPHTMPEFYCSTASLGN